MNFYKDRHGVTLTELMVATVIISIGILGFFGSFKFISRSLHISRTRTLATNLAQEKIETLKNLSYYDLLITTQSAVDNSISPGVTYDTANYPPETISIGGITFTRETFVGLAQVDNDVVSTVTFTFPDTGMKQITVNVLWNDAGTMKKWTLTNLLENPNMNPLDASLSGQVNMAATGAALPSAYVYIEQNPDWNANADSTGHYSFRVYHGSYTVHASSAGFYDAVSSVQSATEGSNITVPTLSLTQIATGTIQGTAWYNPDLVISQIMVSSAQVGNSQSGTAFNGFQAQYVELYNPTTSAINIGTTGSPPSVKLGFGTTCPSNNAAVCDDSTYGVPMVYISTYVAAYHYYLIANTGTFVLNGLWITPDAIYSDTANSYCSPAPAQWNTSASPPEKLLANPGHGPSFWLKRGSTIIDAVGVQHSSNIPPNCEGGCISIGDSSGGFPAGSQIVRISSPLPNLSASDMNAYGRAYDSGVNPNDFAYGGELNSTIMFQPENSLSSAPVVAGVPAVGGIVASTDPYSGAEVVQGGFVSSGTYNLSVGWYSLAGVTTGTWEITIATNDYFTQITTITVLQNVSTNVPNGSTTPSWPAQQVYSALLTSSTVDGFVKGQVTDVYGNPISGITVLAGGGFKTTGSNGSYFVATASGPIQVIANPNNANPSYVQGLANITVNSGQLYDEDFQLTKGGMIQGYLTTGTTPLPNYVVSASIGGAQYGSGTSNSSGVFTIRNLSTGTYTVAPVLDIGQDSNPNSTSATLSTPGATVSVGTFTVSGALGTIAGTVTYNSASLTTGALIVASTGTVTSTPPTVVASSSSALAPFYAVSSKADGTYSLPVRGGNTYNIGVYVPTVSGSGSVTTTFASYSGIAVTPNATTTKNVSMTGP